MRIQYDVQQLRVRIDEDELAQLLAGTPLQATTIASAHWRITARLHLHDQPAPRLDGDASDWTLHLPAADLRALAARLPSRDGLDYLLPVDNGDPLRLLVDVDVHDSRRRRAS